MESPTNAKNTARRDTREILNFKRILESGGVNATYRPVMNPDLEAVVYCSPTVCRMYATAKNTPARMPSRTELLAADDKSFRKSRDDIIRAMRNRMERKTQGVTSESATLITGNVKPQMAETPKRERIAENSLEI